MSTRIREPFNALSHLAGAVLIPAGTLALILANPHHSIAFAIFGLAALILFVSSTLYHWAPAEKSWLQRLDHSAIYIMIAGTYTPIALLGLPSPQRETVLIFQWTLALIGVLLTLTREKTSTLLRLTLYLTMGWMVLPFLTPLRTSISPQAINWLFAGGLAYTGGAIIYATKHPDPWPTKIGSHGLWHLLVLTGAICHLVVMAELI